MASLNKVTLIGIVDADPVMHQGRFRAVARAVVHEG